MNPSKLVLALLLAANSAFAACPNLAGKYSVSVQPFQGNLAGPYGTTRISAAAESTTACIYTLRSNVQDFANPIATGTQSLAISKGDGRDGFAFRLSVVAGKASSTGTLFIGADHLTLSIPLEGCGGEGGGNDCGEEIVLQ